MKWLEALERLGKFRNEDGMFAFQSKDYFFIEKELKALEIIKRHLNMNIYYDEINDTYKIRFGCITFCEIFKEEYELLKEVLL